MRLVPRRGSAPGAALTALGLVLVLSGCGSADDSEPSAQASSSEASESASASPSSSPSPSETAEGPYVPGNPQNQFRPATAQEQREWPACSSIWREGGTIPRAYEGCVRNGENAVVADRISCSFGGSMTTYADRFYGVVGNVVNDADQSLSTSRAYERAHGQCSG